MTVYIQCTAKLLKKLTNNESAPATSSNILGAWHANLLRINRKECVVFTHDTTLYSICVPKTTKHFFNNLDKIFLENLIRNLEYENLQKYIGLIPLEDSQVRFVKSTNRSVLGVINNMTRFIEACVYESGGLENTNILELNKYINRVPFTPIKYNYPIECLQGLLLKHFEAHWSALSSK
jgi:hypothetical protein